MNVMNEWALITGASSGIGYELAKLFAADHFNLVLLARNQARLDKVADELRARHSIQAKVLSKDLGSPNAAREIFDALRGTPISILVNNAGYGIHGLFAENDLDAQTDLMQVNMTSLMQLTHLFLQPMLERRSGRILNVASTAAFQPGPTINVYFASKAFVYSFSYALSEELAGSGVTVTALCPGTTRTSFFERAHFGPTRNPLTMNADKVAAIGYRGMMKGKRVVIPGVMNKIASALAKRMPPRLTARIVRKLHKHTATPER
jgi:short-subunit dehydrogenase